MLRVLKLAVGKIIACGMTSTNQIWKFIHVSTSVSSNTELRDLILADKAKSKTVLWADQQTGGRGRFNRSWVAPKGNLSVSLAVDLPAKPDLSYQLNLLAGFCLVQTVRSFGFSNALLKWPNDVLIQDHKVAGLLSEVISEKDIAIIGIGLNLNSRLEDFSDDLKSHITTLWHEGKKEIDGEGFLNRFLDTFSKYLQIYQSQGLAALLPEVKAMLAWKDQNILVIENETNITEARILDLTPEGFLLIDENDGKTRIVMAADIRLKLN